MPELAEAIRARLEDAFPSEVWVRGEIQNLSRAPSGNVYFTLVGGDDDDGAPAQIPVILSSGVRTRVNRLLRRSGGAVRMTDGTEVRIRGRLDWYAPRGQLQLRMASIDPAFTLGQLAVARAELLGRLRDADLLDANGRHTMPMAPLRIGVVTSVGSAAEADVLHELDSSGFAFEVLVADVRVQGVEAPESIAAGIAGIAARRVDVVLVVRGGGAATDLAAFDAEVVARAIAAAPVPVVTGVGHETDRSVADEVAHTAAKTPTAAAQLVAGMVGEALDRVDEVWAGILRGAVAGVDAPGRALDRFRDRLVAAAHTATSRPLDHVDALGGRIGRSAQVAIDAHARALSTAGTRLGRGARTLLERREDQLAVLDARRAALDPRATLARGWSIVRTGSGQLLRSAADVGPGDSISVVLVDGSVAAVVERTQTDGAGEPGAQT